MYSRDLDVDIFASYMAVFRLEALSRQLVRHVTERGLPQVVHDLNERRPTDRRTVVNVCNKATISVEHHLYALTEVFRGCPQLTPSAKIIPSHLQRPGDSVSTPSVTSVLSHLSPLQCFFPNN
jgi:hypothetical protein